MRIGETIRTCSLSIAAVSMLFAGAAVAQAASSPDAGQNWQLTGVNARLVHGLDASSVRQGQIVEARLDGSVTTEQGVKLDGGTELTGTVTSVQRSSDGGPSSITLNFNKARMKDGKTIPVKVTVLSAFPANAGAQAINGVQEMGQAPRHINPRTAVDQEAGQLRHVSMHSRVQGNNSGTFRDKDGNVKLAAGTYLQVGVASMSKTMSGA